MYLGGIVGSVNSIKGTQVLNCVNQGKVSSTNTVKSIGGIAGECHSGLVSGCKNCNSVIAENASDETFMYVGGILGYIDSSNSDSSVKNCINSGDIISDGYIVAGIVGFYSGALNNNHYVHLKLVEDCTNKGNVTSKGRNSKQLMYDGNTGGIVGHGPAIVNRCYNEGNVTANWDHVGGITGALGSIINSYNKGEITNNNNGTGGGGDVGGLTGLNWSDASGDDQFIINSYNSGKVTATRGFGNAGNLVGTGYTAIFNSYGCGDIKSPEGTKKYAVGTHYNALAGGYTEWAKTKKSVWGGPTNTLTDVVAYKNAETDAEFEFFYEKDDVPYQTVSGSEQTLLSYLQDKQTNDFRSKKLFYSNGELLCEIQTVAWKEGTDHYPVFEHEPGYVEPVVPTYTVEYILNAPGNPSGMSAPMTQTGATSYTVSSVNGSALSYVYNNVKYTFQSWNTKQDGTGVNYEPGSMISPLDGDVTLYGVWKKGFQLRYALASDMQLSDFTALTLPVDGTWYDTDHTTATVAAPTAFNRSDGKVFAFWSTEPDGGGEHYVESDEITVTQDMVLYANVSNPVKQQIVIRRSGLKDGESAIYNITGPDSYTATVVLTGDKGGSEVCCTIAPSAGLATGDYTVTETTWDWSYGDATIDVIPASSKKGEVTESSATGTLSDSSVLTFTFASTQKDNVAKHHESIKIEKL